MPTRCGVWRPSIELTGILCKKVPGVLGFTIVDNNKGEVMPKENYPHDIWGGAAHIP